MSEKIILPEVKSFAQDVEKAESGTLFACPWMSALAISGPDAADFLNRLSTLNIPKVSVGSFHYAAFLNGRGNLISLGVMEKSETHFFFHTLYDQIEGVFEHLQKMHFSENMTIEMSDRMISARVASHTLVWSGEKSEVSVGFRAFEHLRRKFVIPRLHVELGPQNLFMEGNFDVAISENKGCYPGQEVVERIRSYGRVNRLLMPLLLEGDFSVMESKAVLRADEKNVGTVESWDYLPKDQSRGLALGFVHRDFLQYSSYFLATNEKIKAKLLTRHDLENI